MFDIDRETEIMRARGHGLEKLEGKSCHLGLFLIQ